MFRTRVVATLLAGLVLAGTAGAAPAALTPDRTLPRPAAIEVLALTGLSLAYVVSETRTQCEHVELWQTGSGRVQRFGKPTPFPCKEGPSTGSGVWEVGLAQTRVLWTTYVGGNFREWQLWTATPTRPTPRRLRFVARDVDEPAPIVVGPGTPAAVPYAVDRELVYLGENGRAIFRWTAPGPIRAVAAGAGPRGWRVAALQENGTVVVLDATGNPVYDPNFEPKLVRSIRLGPIGLVVQMGENVFINRPSLEHDVIRLPAGARMVDVAQGRIVYQRGRDLGALTIRPRKSVRLVEGEPSKPVTGQLEPTGMAWAKGRTLHWRAGQLPR